MSKVESQIDDAKKLALRCKTLEVQLRQSVSKKDHHEITSKLEKQIDSLERDLDRTRTDNQKTIALNKQIAGVESLISSLIKTANTQGKTLDSIEDEASTRGKALNVQGKALDAIATKIDIRQSRPCERSADVAYRSTCRARRGRACPDGADAGSGELFRWAAGSRREVRRLRG